MPTVTVERTYLRLTAPATAAPASGRHDAPARTDVSIEEERPCSVATYRALYAGVGAPYFWRDRLAWSDDTLADYLARDTVRIWILRDALGVGGYFELCRDATSDAVEIAYFGLLASHHGRGLGRLLLERAIDEGWRWGARSLWLHTCTLDGPAALPNYLARGFVPYHRETYEANLPDP